MLFDTDYANAYLPDGSRLSFTRSEARALEALVSRGGRVLSRSQLLDAVSAEGSEKNDRNIDFLINRVRRKLGDSAKDPKFIATRYGEGYVWLGQAEQVEGEIGEADVIIEPVRGLEQLPAWANIGRTLTTTLAQALKSGHSLMVKVQTCSPAGDITGSGRKGRDLSIDLSFFDNLGNVECIVSAKLIRTGVICFVERLQLGRNPATVSDLRERIERIVPLMLAKSWEAKARTHGQTLPLAVAMHEASGRYEQHDLTWRDNDVRLQTLRRDKPDDPSVKLMYATHLHSKYVTLGFELFRKGEETCATDEAEIERLVLEALEFAQSSPEHAVIAAKLLYFVDGGYKDLACDLIDTALQTSTNVASNLAIVGQFKGFLGDTDAAIHYIRQALALGEKGSTAYLYTLVMLCQALMAANRLDELARAREELYGLSGLKSVFFEPMFSDPFTPSIRAKAFVLMLSRQRARGLLLNLFYVSGRLFVSEEHRENSMRTPINLFVRRFGPDIATDDMRTALPNLLG